MWFGFIEKLKWFFWGDNDIMYSGLPQLEYVGVKWGKETGHHAMNITIAPATNNELLVLKCGKNK